MWRKPSLSAGGEIQETRTHTRPGHTVVFSAPAQSLRTNGEAHLGGALSASNMPAATASIADVPRTDATSTDGRNKTGKTEEILRNHDCNSNWS